MDRLMREWTAVWVWPVGDAAPADSYTWFRAELDIDDPQGLRLHLSADLRYRLWVNDELVGDGPPPSTPEAVYYDTHDLSGRLRPGRNCVALVVRCTGTEPDRRAGLLAELAGPGGVLLATGFAGWRCRRSAAWMSGTATSPKNRFDPFQEMFDARLEPEGWRRVGFDDSGWDEPERVRSAGNGGTTGQWSNVLARPIPAVEEAIRRPVSVTVEECLWLATRTRPDLSIGLSQAGRELTTARAEGTDRIITGSGPTLLACSDGHLSDRTVDGVYDPCILLDLGRQETAYLEFELEGPVGAVVDIGFAERLVDGRFNNAIEGQFAARYVLRKGRQRWRTMAWRGFRYVRVRVSQATEPVLFYDLHAVLTRYPFSDVGSFESADERLNRIFDLCRHTVRLCCHESIMDTPWREQAQWLGDVSAVTAPAIRSCFGDTALIEKFIRQAALTVSTGGTMAVMSNVAADRGSRPDSDIPDYTLWWVIDLLEHHRYTGRDDFVRELFPVVRRVLDGIAQHVTALGTLTSFGWVFIDWADIDKEGECAALNAIFYGALRAGVELACILDETAESARWSSLADRLELAFSERFWDEGRGAFIDAVDSNGRRSEKISEQANFAAIRFGLVPEKVAAPLAVRILDDETATEAQPFFTSVVLDALHLIGQTGLAVHLIDERWGRRMLDRGATSCFEEWGINGSWRSGGYAGFMRTQSHAWSAHPATFLIRNLAGIRIQEPGCRRLSVSPMTGLDFSCSYPTPHGPVSVTVCDGMVTIDAPSGIEIVNDHKGMRVRTTASPRHASHAEP